MHEPDFRSQSGSFWSLVPTENTQINRLLERLHTVWLTQRKTSLLSLCVLMLCDRGETGGPGSLRWDRSVAIYESTYTSHWYTWAHNTDHYSHRGCEQSGSKIIDRDRHKITRFESIIFKPGRNEIIILVWVAPGGWADKGRDSNIEKVREKHTHRKRESERPFEMHWESDEEREQCGC